MSLQFPNIFITRYQDSDRIKYQVHTLVCLIVFRLKFYAITFCVTVTFMYQPKETSYLPFLKFTKKWYHTRLEIRPCNLHEHWQPKRNEDPRKQILFSVLKNIIYDMAKLNFIEKSCKNPWTTHILSLEKSRKYFWDI